jgi:hypothetical protein
LAVCLDWKRHGQLTFSELKEYSINIPHTEEDRYVIIVFLKFIT